MSKKEREALWARRKHDKKHGKLRPYEFYREPRDPRQLGSGLGSWESAPTYIGGNGVSESTKRRWALDERGWKARLSNNPRARRAQILWRYRNSHLRRPYVSPYAVNKFLRRDAQRRRELRIGRGVNDTLYELMGTPKSQTFESPYIKPKDYPF